MAPRGLKTTLKKKVCAKLVGTGKFKGFAKIHTDGSTGPKLKGLTKALAKHIFSNGSLPWSTGSRLGWSGRGGGRRRGAAVDAQLSRIVNSGSKSSAKFRLTRMAISALKKIQLEPVVAQRAAVSGAIGTAADVICYNKKENCLVVVEVKCGYTQIRETPAMKNGKKCAMRTPLRQVIDCALHRHFAQLSVTAEMISRDVVMETVESLGINTKLSAILLYLDDEDAEIFELPAWWLKRGAKILKAIGGT